MHIVQFTKQYRLEGPGFTYTVASADGVTWVLMRNGKPAVRQGRRWEGLNAIELMGDVHAIHAFAKKGNKVAPAFRRTTAEAYRSSLAAL